MGILRNILLPVGLLWAILFRIYPSVAGTVSPAQIGPQLTVKQATHPADLPSDSAVYLIQDEDEQSAPAHNLDFVSSLPDAWLNLLLAIFFLRPIQWLFAGKPASPHPPYYLLYCSLRIPIA